MKKFFLILPFLLNECFGQKLKDHTIDIRTQVWSITEVLLHDAVDPAAAARFYSYSILTGYEIVSQGSSSASRFQDKLNQYPAIGHSFAPTTTNLQLAALYGILETGKNIMPSGDLLKAKQTSLVNEFRKEGIKQTTIDASIEFAKKISQQIVEYSKTDGYFKLSTLPRYKPIVSDSTWQPTPPAYMSAVQPYWNTIRTFFLDSAEQCRAKPLTRFDTSANSPFIQLAREVYNSVNNLNTERTLIASFWDCNPFAVQFQGHMMIGLKKISPGGHWMGITGIACEKAHLDFANTMLLHTLVALTLHDAFISCWDEKYLTNRIRPETVINRYIDEKWSPLLQTPPFPEYSSGHSVISTASAEVLTYFLGDNFSFVDNTETYIGLPERKFNSFRQAAAEARISRLYGGIHYRDAIENGAEQGKMVGDWVIKKLNLKPIK